MSWWTGDEWRWHLTSSSSRPSINVIEPPEQPKTPAGSVPFGFGRVLVESESTVREPQLWEGED